MTQRFWQEVLERGFFFLVPLRKDSQRFLTWTTVGLSEEVRDSMVSLVWTVSELEHGISSARVPGQEVMGLVHIQASNAASPWELGPQALALPAGTGEQLSIVTPGGVEGLYPDLPARHCCTQIPLLLIKCYTDIYIYIKPMLSACWVFFLDKLLNRSFSCIREQMTHATPYFACFPSGQVSILF